jgi:hypothetical protein
MVEMFLKIARFWGILGNKIVKWLTQEQVLVYRSIKALVVLAGLFLVCNALGLIIGIAVIYFPYICTWLILACLIIPPVLFLLSLVFSKISIEALMLAFILSVLLGLVEFGVGMFGGLISMNLPKGMRTIIFPTNVKFPLGRIGGITINSDSNIYLAISNYSRIQKYNSKGEFVKGWFVNTSGVFGIWVHNGYIHAILARTHKHMVFDLNGKAIEDINITDKQEEHSLWEKAERSVCKDPYGNMYLVGHSKWSPIVMKINPNGEKSVVIRNPFYFRLVRDPQPSWYLMIIGLLMSVVFGMLLKYKMGITRNN